jgi:DNA repair photolyase
LFHIDGMRADDPKLRPKACGRGAGYNPANRFDRLVTVATTDGWGCAAEGGPVRTEISVEHPRSAITRNRSPDLGFDRSINPFRGCEHGCIYCFARPSHAYLGLSPGLDFETKLVARPDMPAILRVELSRPSYRVAPLAIGTNTDPYQPMERDLKVMRGVLEVLQAFGHPVGIVTKGTLVERDLDILSEMAADGLVKVGVSVTTLDAGLARRMEPRVPAPLRRLKMIERLAGAGIPVRLMVSPVVPGLTDPEIERLVNAGAAAGAAAASMITLRLPLEVAPLFRDWLQTHMPDRAARVMARVREMQGGKDYASGFGTRMTGTGVYAEMLQQRFARALRAAGLHRELPPLRCDLFAVPTGPGDQLSLF